MGRVTQLKGREGWYVEFWHPARHRNVRVRVRGTRAEASRLLTELQAKAQREHLLGPAATATNDVEIAALVTAWRAHNSGRVRPRTWQSYAFCLHDVLTWMEAHNRPRSVRDIRLADMEFYKAELLERGLAGRCVDMRVGALRQVLRWALREGRIASNPLEGWRPVGGPQKRDARPLTAFEIGKLLAASPSDVADVWIVFLETGLRFGELSSLEWQDIDLEARQLRVRGETSKSRRTRFVAMTDRVASILGGLRLRLAERPETGDARRFVFVNSKGNRWRGNLWRRFKRCAARAGLPKEGVHLHALRHTFATYAIHEGCDVKTLQDILGHSTAKVTLDWYAHAFERRAAEVVGLVGRVVEEAESSARRARAAEA
ncbi:MAG: hypothetical protein FJ291_00150 [Planctomycetes bacterium]|nr:hypothetical protein [Planctomycetota bacterium]